MPQQVYGTAAGTEDGAVARETPSPSILSYLCQCSTLFMLHIRRIEVTVN